MKINVLLSPVFADELYYSGKVTAVIDVLRATTTICTALANGAKEVIPVASVESAVKVSGGMFGGLTLLGGERNTKKIEGFALGNSPLEYTQEVVQGKSIVLYTTNGSKAIVKAKFSSKLFILSFNNLNAVAEKLLSLDKDIEILCSGRNNGFSLEDTICAGKLITEIMKVKEDAELSDGAKISYNINKTLGKNLHKVLMESDHGKILSANGFDEDLKYCSKLNSCDIVPLYASNVIKISH